MCERVFLGQPPHRELRQRAEHEDQGREPADQHQRHIAEPLVDDLRQRHRHDVEDQAGGERDHDEQAEHGRGDPGREPHVRRRGVALDRLVVIVGNEPKIDDAGQDTDHRRNDEGAAPSDHRCQHGGDAGRERDAEIAAHAVEGERAAARGRLLDQHRGADRMIDRGEHAERRQRDRQRDQVRRQRRADQRHAAAEIEQRHHVAPAPAVGEPAGRQREDRRR